MNIEKPVPYAIERAFHDAVAYRAVRYAISPGELTQLMRVLYERAIAGDVQAAHEILDRSVGPVTSPHLADLSEHVAALVECFEQFMRANQERGHRC